MRNNILYILFLALFSLDYLANELQLISPKVAWAPELISGIVLALVLFRATATRSVALQRKYGVVFALFCLCVLGGIIVNFVEAAPIFAGLRTYFKYAPFFLLPAVYDYSDKELTAQLKFLLALALIQCPIAVYQRFIEFAGIGSGDSISGTLLISSALSIFLISAISVLFAFYLRRRINIVSFLLIVIFLFIPTTINETKGTLVLLPLALVLTVLFFPTKSIHLRRQLLTVCALGLVFVGSFMIVYDHLYTKVGGVSGEEIGIIDRFAIDALKSYLAGDVQVEKDVLNPIADKLGLGPDMPEQRIRRLDSMRIVFEVLQEEPVKFIVGLGIGNVAESAIGGFSGAYVHYRALGSQINTVSHMLWEVGLLGFLLLLIFFLLIFKDALQVRNRDDLAGTLASGWLGVVAIMIVSLAYKNLWNFQTILYIFWYLSGYLAANRYRELRSRIALRTPQAWAVKAL
jgi:hypothetical protein